MALSKTAQKVFILVKIPKLISYEFSKWQNVKIKELITEPQNMVWVWVWVSAICDAKSGR